MRMLFRLGVLVLIACFCPGAIAQQNNAEKLQLGVGIICDSSEQVQHYLTVYGNAGSPDVALRAVNEEANNRPVCGMAAIAFIPGDQVGTVDVSGGAMRIMQITVVATETDHGWLQVAPIVQYTALFEKLEEV